MLITKTKSLFVIASFLLCGIFFNSEISAQTSNIPQGSWTFSIHSYQGNNYLTAPVVIYQVTSKDAKVDKFYIYNISKKPVKGIKVKWMLSENQNRSNFLEQGRTQLLNFSTDLQSGYTAYIKYPVVALTDFSNNYLVDGKLNKNFDVDLMVDEVIFADTSVWKVEDGAYSQIEQSFVSAMSSPTDCPRQKCVSSASKVRNRGVTYSCGSSEVEESCINTVNAEDCTNSACVRATSGGNGGSPFEMILL